MTVFGTEIRYGTIAQAFHWVTAALVLAAWLVAGGGRSPTIVLHETIGLTIFVLVCLRLLWRAFDRQPDQPPMPKAMAWSSVLVHWLLFGLLLAVPFTAIIGTQLEGHALTIYGLGVVGPFLTASSRYLGHQLLELHQLIGNLIIWLAGLHAAAALYHHYFMKDGVLKAMLPGGRAA